MKRPKKPNKRNEMSKPDEAPEKITRTSAGLRDAIFDEIDYIRAGQSNPTRANAVAKLATGIVETVRMEIEVEKFARGGNPKEVAPSTKSLALGEA